jgi:hypothetical protein
MFRLYLAPLATLNRCGRALSQHDREIVKQVLATGYAQQVAEVPFREMDVDWTLIRLEYPLPQSPSSNMSQLIARSLIGRRLPALEFSRQDTYNFTHLIFYVTDWGRVDWPLDKSTLNYVQTSVIQLLGIWLSRKDWDLVGELIIVSAAARILNSQIVQSALNQFIAAQLPDGTFPTRNNAKPNFWNTYHTVLVAIVLDLVVLHSRGQGSIDTAEIAIPENTIQLIVDGLHRCRQLGKSLEQGNKCASFVNELLTNMPSVELLARQLPPFWQSMNGQSYLPLLEALASNDISAIGTNLSLGVTTIPPPIGFGAMAWLFARQNLDGHFGSLEPERRALKKQLGRTFDFNDKVQWPTTLTVLAGISDYLDSIQSFTEESRFPPNESSRPFTH